MLLQMIKISILILIFGDCCHARFEILKQYINKFSKLSFKMNDFFKMALVLLDHNCLSGVVRRKATAQLRKSAAHLNSYSLELRPVLALAESLRRKSVKKDKPQSLKNRKNKQAGIDSDHNHNDFFNDDDERWSRSKEK